jgi:hypothetical protein
MKPCFALAIFLSGCGVATACDHTLVGTWKSDKQATMAFVQEHTKLQPKTQEFLDALFGHMTLTFSESELHLVMPDLVVPVSGELRPFAGSEERKPYKVLFCNESMIVWSAKRSSSTGDSVTTYYFSGPDTVWVYTGTTEPGLPDLHAREYFQRVRPEG